MPRRVRSSRNCSTVSIAAPPTGLARGLHVDFPVVDEAGLEGLQGQPRHAALVDGAVRLDQRSRHDRTT